jgi:thiol:disulfide interchange protein DsbA
MSARHGPLAALLAAAFALPVLAQTGFPARYLSGEHYRTLSEPAPAAADRVEVLEFFLYACPHCRAFEPAFRDWAADAPGDVRVRRVPVLYGAAGRTYARLFYTARSLGVLEELHGAVFAAIHDDGRRLTDRAAIRALFLAHGVDGAAFDAAFDSEDVAARVEEAGTLMHAYQVTSVPSLGVNGKYWISGAMAGGQDRMTAVADYLVAKERGAP